MDYKPFKMKGFPMQKGTGSYLKEVSAMKMKKEAMAKMKKEAMAKMKEEEGMKMKKESMAKLKEAMKMKKESMAKQAKPDFLDLDGDGNKKESMKQAAADKKGSPASQKYDKSDTDERVYDLDQKKYDKFRSTQGKNFPDIRYLGKKENKKFLEEYLKRKDNKIVSKSISKSDKDSPAPQKMSYQEAFDYMTGGDKSDKKKTRKAKRKVKKSIKKGEKMKGEAFPGHFMQVPNSMYREGTEENKKMKKRLADEESPTKQTAKEAKKATKKARKFVRKANKLTDKANKYIKRKGKDASMVVEGTGETVERYELNPRQAKKATKKMDKAKKAFSKAKGIEAEFMSKNKKN